MSHRHQLRALAKEPCPEMISEPPTLRRIGVASVAFELA